MREHQRKSYRGAEALLRDSAHWCHAIGMSKVPDHNTLCRAFAVVVNGRSAARLLDVLARWMAVARLLGRTLGIDSTLHDVHYRSRHYEQRCRHHASRAKRTGNARRARSARRTPKLAIGVDTASHLILAARPRTGMGSDAPDFAPVLQQAKRRSPRRLQHVLADAGFDSHANHAFARQLLRVRALIKTGVGRPTSKPPALRYRRRMQRELSGSQKGKLYAQRAQVECVNSMMKRNLGDHLRSRGTVRRRFEQLLRCITHNLMIIRRVQRGSRQSHPVPVSAPHKPPVNVRQTVRHGNRSTDARLEQESTIHTATLPFGEKLLLVSIDIKPAHPPR